MTVAGRPGARPDRYWMEQALALGAIPEGSTSPNPRVGCVLVRDDRLVGRGFHRAPGRPHAEAAAVAEAGDLARGATAYVNLEPCAHHGRTPPCAELLVRSGIARVVAAVRDPNPLVDGKGFEFLRERGVQVEVGLLAEPARRLNLPFLHFHGVGRPLVTLKAGVSLDGIIAATGGRSRWITGEPARCFAHRLRYRHDAVLVGAETVRRDDPQLTVRLPDVVASRMRVALAPNFDLDPKARIFHGDAPEGPPTRVYGSIHAPADAASRLAGAADVIRIPGTETGLDLAAVLDDLAACGVQSVLVEGGGRTFASFLDAGLADRAALFFADKLLGAEGATALIGRPSVVEPAQGWRLRRPLQLALGRDLLLMGDLRPPQASPAGD